MFIGPALDRKYELFWPAARFVWPESFLVRGGPLWGMFQCLMDIIDMSVLTPKGNRYVLVIVDCFLRWTLPNKTALAVTDAFCQLIGCRFGMPAVIHSDQGQEFENNLMQDMCILCGAHKTCMTPYHPASDGLAEQFNKT